MKRTVAALIILVAPFGASAAAFYGSLTIDGQLPGREVPIELVCANTVIASETVDPRGSYRFTNLAPRGDCVVRVQGATAPVALYPNPTRFDYALTHLSGRPVLKQR